MLSIIRAMLINPGLLILDEPSKGLTPLTTGEVFRIVAQMRTGGFRCSWSSTCKLSWMLRTMPM